MNDFVICLFHLLEQFFKEVLGKKGKTNHCYLTLFQNKKLVCLRTLNLEPTDIDPIVTGTVQRSDALSDASMIIGLII